MSRGLFRLLMGAVLFYALLSALSSRAQPYFHERDGGVTRWDAGKSWPNPDGEDRLRDYPPVTP